MRLSEVSKYTNFVPVTSPNSERERAKRIRNQMVGGLYTGAAGVGGLALTSPSRNSSGVFYGQPAKLGLKDVSHRLTGSVYSPARKQKVVVNTAGEAGVRRTRVPTLQRGRVESARGLIVGRSVPTALHEVMGNEAPGKRVVGVRLRAGGKYRAGTVGGVAARTASAAAVVGGGALLVDAYKKSKQLGGEIRRRSAAKAAETRRRNAERDRALIELARQGKR